MTLPDASLPKAADRLRSQADRLREIELDDIGRPTEEPAHDLARAVVIWSIALRELAPAGLAALTGHVAGIHDGSPADDLVWERAQLRLLTAVVAGDVLLDSLAWAELVRRKRWEPPQHTGLAKVPVLWTVLMKVLDEPSASNDPMRPPARYLDLSLDAARDMLVAHRDPELHMMRGAASWGRFTIDLFPHEQDRLETALEQARGIRTSVDYLPPDPADTQDLAGAFASRTEILLQMAVELGAEDRRKLRSAYRIGGISSPSLGAIAERVCVLVDLYLAARVGESTERADPRT